MPRFRDKKTKRQVRCPHCSSENLKKGRAFQTHDQYLCLGCKKDVLFLHDELEEI